MGNENVGKTSLARSLVEFWNAGKRKASSLPVVLLEQRMLAASPTMPAMERSASLPDAAAVLTASSLGHRPLPRGASQADIVPQPPSRSSSSTSLDVPSEHSSSAADAAAKGVLPELSTDGVVKYEVAVQARETIFSVTLLDFAGQEVYHASHFLFLADRCVYIVAFDISQPFEHSIESVTYWLRIVASVSSSAPVILVATHLDHKNCTPAYLENYYGRLDAYCKASAANVVSFFSVSNRGTKKHLPELGGMIVNVIAGVPGVCDAMPLVYSQLEQQLRVLALQLRPPIITMAKFSELASSAGIEHVRVLCICSF